ncbi:hypothetical protein DICPUDRAFT_153948 [Dictyostelium purpureum]|uniref:Uncharacterized protein n=1 Tax=Dictyostelium purpureum TaxID=5786 RepID=F0ZQ58_DICPU|nr:uncharacterized protein DICPUDRAFT_153948 [Dictyostelium purpureum]EGC33927.1 hypothetical protein DICPUDRAFT_153948 [Dictyostelium purpureum]|eukprot:XP_003289562.1 hypothetical protein DICPUDRAFT_153948 [Dictyostelium purpureum]
MSSKTNHIMGIDFGTHYACVGVFKNGRVEICPNQQGNRTTPSVVSFVGEDKLVGDEARAQMDRNPQNTIYDVKRILGRKTNEESFESEIKKLSFRVTTYEDNFDKIYFNVNYKEKNIEVTPIEITTNILQQIRHTAETFIGGDTIKKAVITVPTDYTEKQRKDLKDAAQAAGINVVRFIHEHSAVALAYGYDEKTAADDAVKHESNVMVFDLGGSGVSVSMVKIKSKLFEIIGNVSDHNVSGEHFDQVLFQHFTQEFNRKYKVDLKESARSKAKLKSACEKAKRNLSNMNQASVEIDSLYEGLDFFTNITRARFEDLAGSLFKSAIRAVSTLLEKCDMKKEQVDKVLLVGGGSRIPAIQSQLSAFFDQRAEIIDKSMNQEEVVAYGATLQANILSQMAPNQPTNSLSDKKISSGNTMTIEATNKTIGIEDSNGNLIPVIPALSLIPCKRTFNINNTQDAQTSLNMSVYQGDQSIAKDNQLISNLQFKYGSEPLEITFEVDKSSNLLISSKQSNFKIPLRK